MKTSIMSLFIVISLGFANSLSADTLYQSKQSHLMKSRAQAGTIFQPNTNNLANSQGTSNYSCALYYGEWVCTAVTEALAHQACKVGVGSDYGGCSTNPDGTTSCTCGNNQ